MNESIGFFKQIGLAFAGLVKPSCFDRLSKQKAWKTIIYAILFSILGTAIQWGLIEIKFAAGASLVDAFDNAPPFSYDNGILSMDDIYHYETSGYYLYINTDYDKASLNDISDVRQSDILNVPSRDNVFVLTKTNVGLYNSTNGQTQVVDYSDIQSILGLNSHLDNNNFMTELTGFVVKVMIFISVFFAFINIFFVFVINSNFFSIIGLIIKSFTHAEIGYGELYKMSIFVASIAILLKRINSGLGTIIPGWIMNLLVIIIIVTYMTLAIISRSNNPNGYGNAVSPMSYSSFEPITGSVSTPNSMDNMGNMNNNFGNMNANPNANSFGNMNANPNANSFGNMNANPNANSFGNMNANPNANNFGSMNANPNANGFGNMNANPNANNFGNMNANPNQSFAPNQRPVFNAEDPNAPHVSANGNFKLKNDDQQS